MEIRAPPSLLFLLVVGTTCCLALTTRGYPVIRVPPDKTSTPIPWVLENSGSHNHSLAPHKDPGIKEEEHLIHQETNQDDGAEGQSKDGMGTKNKGNGKPKQTTHLEIERGDQRNVGVLDVLSKVTSKQSDCSKDCAKGFDNSGAPLKRNRRQAPQDSALANPTADRQGIDFERQSEEVVYEDEAYGEQGNGWEGLKNWDGDGRNKESSEEQDSGLASEGGYSKAWEKWRRATRGIGKGKGASKPRNNAWKKWGLTGNQGKTVKGVSSSQDNPVKGKEGRRKDWKKWNRGGSKSENVMANPKAQNGRRKDWQKWNRNTEEGGNNEKDLTYQNSRRQDWQKWDRSGSNAENAGDGNLTQNMDMEEEERDLEEDMDLEEENIDLKEEDMDQEEEDMDLEEEDMDREEEDLDLREEELDLKENQLENADDESLMQENSGKNWEKWDIRGKEGKKAKEDLTPNSRRADWKKWDRGGSVVESEKQGTRNSASDLNSRRQGWEKWNHRGDEVGNTSKAPVAQAGRRENWTKWNRDPGQSTGRNNLKRENRPSGQSGRKENWKKWGKQG